MNDCFEAKDNILTIPHWSKLKENLVTGFTTKHGGFSKSYYTSLNVGLHVQDRDIDVIKNRIRVAENVNFPFEKWIFADQIHKNTITKITQDHKGAGTTSLRSAIQATDGLYTNDQGVMLALCFADCVPLYFLAPSKNYIGIAHAGWRGTVSNIAGKMVQTWLAEGVRIEEIHVVIGPSIESCCYIVDNKVICEIENVLDNSKEKPYNLIEEGQYCLNLKEVNKQLILQTGISDNNILVSNYCTGCESDMFFSHRRDLGKTGRMMSFIGLKEE
ncbi:peptidoglycan editing factor PgeF [Bacillus sp. HMF5848]|uniref:peptidoglycan editing factor PgeF n=1 Tax=Bacillus sp. HMF5848 TaxID=2495421 RepID=UPI000F78118B|nr:peptidoglycan editing factor PgeF [Bacillus sp. HMF5848]RSK26952.1 peptidoglycan editing factor PgeF [Bacillus sp. HMF5848]